MPGWGPRNTGGNRGLGRGPGPGPEQEELGRHQNPALTSTLHPHAASVSPPLTSTFHPHAASVCRTWPSCPRCVCVRGRGAGGAATVDSPSLGSPSPWEGQCFVSPLAPPGVWNLPQTMLGEQRGDGAEPPADPGTPTRPCVLTFTQTSLRWNPLPSHSRVLSVSSGPGGPEPRGVPICYNRASPGIRSHEQVLR